jgi:hypothetical protein
MPGGQPIQPGQLPQPTQDQAMAFHQLFSQIMQRQPGMQAPQPGQLQQVPPQNNVSQVNTEMATPRPGGFQAPPTSQLGGKP